MRVFAAVLLQVATDGNWMHIHFQSKIQARKALSKNGKVFGTGVMVGVHQCIDKVMFTFSHQCLQSSTGYRNPAIIQHPHTHAHTHIDHIT